MGRNLPARRPPTEPPALVTTSLKALEEAIGGREALVAALAHAPRSKDLDYLLGLLGDPTESGKSLAYLCAAGGVTAGELLDAYKSGIVAQAQARSMPSVAEGLPKVVADTFRRAAPYVDTCYQCKGLGTFVPEPSAEEPDPVPLDCPVCGTKGILTYPGDLEHKKLALTLGGFGKAGSGVNVQVDNRQVHLHGGPAGGSLEKLQEITDRLLFGEGPLLSGGDRAPRVVEGEVAQDPPEEPREDSYP